VTPAFAAAPLYVDFEYLYHAANATAGAQGRIHEAVGLLCGRLDFTAAMAAGQAAPAFVRAYDDAVHGLLTALESAVAALGVMAHCLATTANNLVEADHASHATTVHASAETRSLPHTVSSPRYRVPPTAGGPGVPEPPALHEAARAWQAMTDALVEGAETADTALRQLHSDAQGAELDAVHHHWSALWRGPDDDGVLLSGTAVAAARLADVCRRMAAAAEDDLADPAALQVTGTALTVGRELHDLVPQLKTAADGVPRIRVVRAETLPCPRVPEPGAHWQQVWSPPPRTIPLDLGRQRVALLTGGELFGSTSDFIHVIGKNNEYILVGESAGAHDLLLMGARLTELRRLADKMGETALAYFPCGTSEAVVAVARRILGPQRVHLFEL
jgi:hypothetical protein